MTPASEENDPTCREARRKLQLPAGVPIAQGLRRAFAGVHTYALTRIDAVEDDATAAVHEFRKSIRRLRALVRFARDLFLDDTARQLDGTLRDIVLPTSGLRDGAVLETTLRDLPARPESDRARAAVLGALCPEALRPEALRPGLESTPPRGLEPGPGREGRVLRAAREPLVAVAADFRRAFAPRVSLQELEQALAGVLRRARRALRRAVGSDDDDLLHRWRKRIKELRYTLELLRDRGDELLARRQRETARLAEDLGRLTDVLVLRDAVLDLAPTLTVPCAPLIEDLDLRRALRIQEVEAEIPEFLRSKPRPIAREIVAGLTLSE